ncbi:MAG: hypothetical protein AB8D78_15785, partial [Akkermansiaceae bacterium]
MTTTYAYDKNNNRLSLTDSENKTRSWTYGPRNLVLTKSMPDPSDTCSYSYDTLRRLKEIWRAGFQPASSPPTITMVYDLAGRMTSRQYSDATTDTFTYDAASRLLTATKGRHAITTTRTYADDGMMLSEKQSLDGRD